MNYKKYLITEDVDSLQKEVIAFLKKKYDVTAITDKDDNTKQVTFNPKQEVVNRDGVRVLGVNISKGDKKVTIFFNTEGKFLTSYKAETFNEFRKEFNDFISPKLNSYLKEK